MKFRVVPVVWTGAWMACLGVACSAGSIGDNGNVDQIGGAGGDLGAQGGAEEDPLGAGGALDPDNDDGTGGDADTSDAGMGTPMPPRDDAAPGHSTPSDGSVPAGDATPANPPVGLVPMFVAAGQGGRTVTSCDDGRTWIANHVYENANEDHSPFTHKGLAYGNGMFMVILAWGADVSLKTSTDGVNWSRNTNFDGGFYGGIAYGGDRFVMLRQGVTQHSSDRGKTWTRARTQPRNDYREGGGGDGLPGAKGVFGGGGGDTPSMSWDGGETFTTASACPTIDFGGIGQQGGVAAGGGHLVFVSGNGDYCHVTDAGKTISKGHLGGAVRGKLFFTGGKFWVASGSTLYSSDTGATWAKRTVTPASVSLHAVAVGNTGTFVGVGASGSDFYRSSDGQAWQKVTGPSGPSLFRVVFGYGSPSAMCPVR